MNRTPRTVNLADPLWTALETMSREMGVDRDVLLSQAIFSLARQFGFITPTQVNLQDAASVPAPAPTPPAPVQEGPVEAVRAGKGMAPSGPERARPAARRETPAEQPAQEAEPFRLSDADSIRAIVAEAERLGDPEEEPPVDAAAGAEAGEEAAPDDGADAVTPSGRETMGAEEEVAPPVITPAVNDAEKPRVQKPGARVDRTIIVPPGRALRVQLDQGEAVLVAGERFVMGRGAHCDLVVKSAKVSREHAAVVKEGAEYFIEDLQSSNGTWFQDTRITRRHVSDGDEYLLGGIPVTFTLR